MQQTLDQKRATFAWTAVRQSVTPTINFDTYKNLAKGAPALIMGNGLMPSLAFYRSRNNNPAAQQLLKNLLGWLPQSGVGGANAVLTFNDAMEALQKSPSLNYMRATDEVLAMLKWLRQFADAIDLQGN